MSSRKGSPCYGNVSLQSISLWYSGLYCVSPSLCNSLYRCWFSGCFVIPSSIFWALRPVQCLVSSPPLSLHSGPWSSVLTPAAHPGPDVGFRITALSHRVWAPVKFANSCEASLQSPSFHTVHERPTSSLVKEKSFNVDYLDSRYISLLGLKKRT